MQGLMRKDTIVSVAAALLIVLAAAGCMKRRWETRVEETGTAMDRSLAGLTLAGVDAAGGLEPVKPSTAVVIGRSEILVFNAALVRQWWDEVLARDVRSLDEAFLAALFLKKTKTLTLSQGRLKASDLGDGQGGYLIKPLFNVLREAAQVEKDFSRQYDAYPFKGIVTLYIDEKASFEVISRVVYTAGQAEYSGYRFVVETKSGRRVIPVDAPRYGLAIEREPHDPDSTEDEASDCAEPQAVIRTKGIMLYAMRGSTGGGAYAGIVGTGNDVKTALEAMGEGLKPEAGDEEDEEEGEEEKEPLPAEPGGEELKFKEVDEKILKKFELEGKGLMVTLGIKEEDTPDEPGLKDWHGRVILGPDRACPSVPRKGGKLDLKALAVLIEEVKKMAPGCSRALVSASSFIPWHEIAALMTTVKIKAGFENLIMTVPFDEETFDAEACSDGIRPGAAAAGL